MPNHLAGETSPYLKQHKDNPVNWYPWGETAISRARAEDKPIFLSIGYSACHWCHVMAHESFDDAKIAKILNEYFISIKVDREERPDLDDVYMQAVLMLTGQGGWPMSVFLTPELEPFYGGTYFPPEPRYGMPSFKQVLLSIVDSWKQKRSEIQNSAQKITDSIQSQFSEGVGTKSNMDFEQIINTLYSGYDWQYGGWGNAPKFPPSMLIEFLLQRAWGGDVKSMEMVEHLLERMAMGGMYDLVGGGFHRYSVDRQWLVPHFEKMLYDNAMLALAYLHGFSVSRNTWFRQVAVQTLEFIQKEMISPEGGFYSSLDADTPEGEGRFYAWKRETLKSILSPSELEFLAQTTTISPQGNFEEALNILQLKSTFASLAEESSLSKEELQSKIEPILNKMLKHRKKKQAPEKDTKIIVSWNALAIRAFAQAGRMLNRNDFVETGRNALDLILGKMLNTSGKLNRVWHEGKANHPGTLSDYAGLILALHALYEIDFSPDIYKTMQDLFGQLQKQFAPKRTFYYDASNDVGNLVTRPRSLQDNAIPSGNALAAHVHWLLWNFEYLDDNRNQLEDMLSRIADQANRYPNHFGYWMQIADRHLQDTLQIALVTDKGPDTLIPFIEKYHTNYHPYSVIAAKTQQDAKDNIPALLKDKVPVNQHAAAYICRNFTCQRPLTSSQQFFNRLMEQRSQK